MRNFKKLFIVLFIVFLVAVPTHAQLLAHWEFEGNVNDSTGNGWNGVIVNNVFYVQGVHGQGVDSSDFVNEDNYIYIPTSGSLANGLGQMTVCCWYKANWRGTEWAPIVAKFGEEGYGWQLRSHDKNDQLCFTVRGCVTADESPRGTTLIYDGQWHHLAGVYDGTERRIYVDGVLDRTEPTTGTISSNVAWITFFTKMREDGTVYRFAKGVLDEVRIYDNALSEAEIQALAEPNNAINESPANDGAGIDPNLPATLSWQSNAASFDVYFSDTESDLTPATPLATFKIASDISENSTIIPSSAYPLTEFARYYWRVDERDGNGVISQGHVWSFKVGGKICHLDAEHVQTSFGRISKMLDQTGRGNDAVMPTLGLMPVLVVNGPNGHPVADFNGVTVDEYDKAMVIESNPNDFDATHFTWFIVFKKNNAPDQVTGCVLFNKYEISYIETNVWGTDVGWGGDRMSCYAWSSQGISGDAPLNARSFCHESIYGWNLIIGMSDPSHTVNGAAVNGYLNPFTTSKPTLESALMHDGFTQYGLIDLTEAGHMGSCLGHTLSESRLTLPLPPYSGCWKGGDSSFAGQIAEVIIYNRGMDPNEIAGIAQQLKNKYDYGEDAVPGEVLTVIDNTIDMEELEPIAEQWLVSY